MGYAETMLDELDLQHKVELLQLPLFSCSVGN